MSAGLVMSLDSCFSWGRTDGRNIAGSLPVAQGTAQEHVTRTPSNDVEPLQVDALHSSEHTAHFQHEHLSTNSTGKAFDIIIESPSLPPLDYNPRYPTKEIQIRVDRQPLPFPPSTSTTLQRFFYLKEKFGYLLAQRTENTTK